MLVDFPIATFGSVSEFQKGQFFFVLSEVDCVVFGSVLEEDFILFLVKLDLPGEVLDTICEDLVGNDGLNGRIFPLRSARVAIVVFHVEKKTHN